jgi:hypothetical protein
VKVSVLDAVAFPAVSEPVTASVGELVVPAFHAKLFDS